MTSEVISLSAGQEKPPCGWSGTIEEFLKEDFSNLLSSLSSHHTRCMQQNPSNSQVHAWKTSLHYLAEGLSSLIGEKPEAHNWGLLLEYELPRERGRRPDAILLVPEHLVIIEFKESQSVLPEYLDQVKAYARDLNEYHSASHNLLAIPILAIGGKQTHFTCSDAVITGSPNLGVTLKALLNEASGKAPDLRSWIAADYSPLPTLVSAARTIFRHEPLPSIRRAQSAGIPKAIEKLSSVAVTARERGEKHLVFITGVPGAGKTLVGLQFVYLTHFEPTEAGKEAVFLSGNGPLVKVLQHALQSSIFVQDVHGFLKTYGGKSSRVPMENIWVYDEAQRAWDAERVREKRGEGISEPADFLNLGGRKSDWTVVVGLIGEGQEIHLGEEAGLTQWNDAIRKAPSSWHVHCPPRISEHFGSAFSLSADVSLDLTVTLRSHLASDIQNWVFDLLNGDLSSAKQAATRAREQGYAMYFTDNLERAKSYVQARYHEVRDARYGLLASSKAKNLSAFGVRNEYNFTKNMKEGPWFNDEPGSRYSCCQLSETATEFQCQGLELDFPIVCWGDDLWWENTRWQSNNSGRSKAKDPHRLRINSYRVLLSRGRDGLIVFLPPNSKVSSKVALRESGLLDLENTLGD